MQIFWVSAMATGNIWEQEYRHRGRVWGGVTADLPDVCYGERCLELGCGTGKTLHSLLNSGSAIVAVDISPSALSQCKAACTNNLSLEIATTDIMHLPFRDDVFSASTLIHVLGHLNERDRKMCISEIIRVLRPGGIIIFRGFSSRDFRYKKGTEIEPGTFRRGNGLFTHYFSLEELKSLFSGLSFETASTHSWTLRIRGKDNPREEITVVVRKRSNSHHL